MHRTHDTHDDPFAYERAHRELARWLCERGVKAIYQSTGGNNEIVVVDAPSVPAILAYTPGGDETWGSWAYPRRQDGDAYEAFWGHDGVPNMDGNEPDEDAPVEAVGRYVLNQIATFKLPPVCACPDHSDGLIEAPECVCIPECIRGEAWALDFADRSAMVAWLVENDPNGCHSDEDATLEMGAPHTPASALASYRAVMDLE
jgi:hypothetical protein